MGVEATCIQVEILGRLSLVCLRAFVGEEFQVALKALLCNAIEGGENSEEFLIF